ncbi:ferredoxin family protein [Pseudonocardia sp. NPDC049635]|uniref:indolepyruvate ferredoxin oxidoreductase subunit alpha n=1 Tax=Pseudonocardia sp. NPDC049635 TaxID=3155506 RepID=UPI0033D30D1D
MAFVIGVECIDVLDRSCMDVCPVDCIYTGLRKNYINPDECIDCSACLSVCPVDAVYPESKADTEERRVFVSDSADFFREPLPGRDRPLGNPGGSMGIGDIGVDTAVVAQFPASGAPGPEAARDRDPA